MTATKKPAPTVSYVTIDASHSGQRLDNFLIGQLKGVPKTRIYRILRKGEVRINKGRSAPDYRLQTGDVVRIPPVRVAESRPAPDVERYRWLETRILYEDDAFLAIDKPSGMAVHGGSGVSFGIIEALRQLRPQARFLELVHRLDRETSGCLLVAKKRSALTSLHKLLREDGLDKRYLALVKGDWEGGTLTVEAALEKNQLQSGERMVKVHEAGKPSESRFKPKKRFGIATLVEIQLLTGRTHQARVHAAHIGYPIAGDEKYGAKDFNRELHKLGLSRLFLHAAELRFAHPIKEGEIAIKAPLPPELESVLRQLHHETQV